MTLAVAIMYAVAALAAATGAWLLLRLRGRATPQARYAHGMVGTMASALGLILAIFATAQWSWASPP
ncbi:hypothetical protein [Sphingomonas japonica]|uniref:Uncharacterized protein n=1 Tax=Sphingomonas japonica TaxID=511662 RepID=A0ABX0U2U5_9SPHN|nr:hypothetical protein [Sphingomonas japonica]NIJ23637.1 hypothetical protein [Sphingomonas japonica]